MFILLLVVIEVLMKGSILSLDLTINKGYTFFREKGKMILTLTKKKKSVSRRNFDRRVSQRRLVDLAPPGGVDRRKPGKPDRRCENRRRSETA